MKYLLIAASLLFIGPCKTSEQKTSASDTTAVDSIARVVETNSVPAQNVEAAMFDYEEAPVEPDIEPEKMEIPEIPEDNFDAPAINRELAGTDTLFNILARKDLVKGGDASVNLVTKKLLDLNNPNSNLLAVFIEVNVSEANEIDRTLAIFDGQGKLMTYRFPEFDFQTTEQDTRVVEAEAITLSDGRDAIKLTYKSDGKFDVVSYGSSYRTFIYAFDDNRFMRIFEYYAKSYDFQGADGWISKTITRELVTENCTPGKLCDLVVITKTLNESSEGVGESVAPTIARYTFNGKVYIRSVK